MVLNGLIFVLQVLSDGHCYCGTQQYFLYRMVNTMALLQNISSVVLSQIKVTNCIVVHLAIHTNIHPDVSVLSGITIDPTIYVLLKFHNCGNTPSSQAIKYLYKHCKCFKKERRIVNDPIRKVWLHNTMKLPAFIKINVISGYNWYNMWRNRPKCHSKSAVGKFCQVLLYALSILYTCATIHCSTLYLYNLLLLH